MTQKGAKNVKLKNASTSHKRITMTPVINAAGAVEIAHILFSNLKNVPKGINPGILADVNMTGMWSEKIADR